MNAKSFILTFCAILTLGLIQAQPNVETLLQKADEAVNKHPQMTFTFKYKERMRGGRIAEGDMDLKVIEADNINDKLVYTKARKPQKAQLLWGIIPGKVWVNKGIKLKLSPTAGLLLKDSHHPIYRAGFKRTRDIIMDTYRARKADVTSMVKIVGSKTFDGRDCWHIELTDDKYAIVNYTVKAGDNLLKIAEAKAIPEMRILELNPGIKDYFDVSAGQTIKIPTSYGKKTTMYVDKETYAPLYQKVVDDLGLFTEYGHYNLNLNPGLTKEDFVWQ